jgi:hypothetical protein
VRDRLRAQLDASFQMIRNARDRGIPILSGNGGAVLLLDEASQDAALSGLGLTDLWGVSGRLAVRLSRSAFTHRSVSSAGIRS